MLSRMFDELLKEYSNAPAALHFISGVGFGIFLSGLFFYIAYQGIILGLILIAIGIGGKYFINK